MIYNPPGMIKKTLIVTYTNTSNSLEINNLREIDEMI